MAPAEPCLYKTVFLKPKNIFLSLLFFDKLFENFKKIVLLVASKIVLESLLWPKGIFAALNAAFQGPTFLGDSRPVEIRVRTCPKMYENPFVCVSKSVKTQRNAWLMALYFDIYPSGFFKFKLSCQR